VNSVHRCWHQRKPGALILRFPAFTREHERHTARLNGRGRRGNASAAATINIDEIDGFLRDKFGFDKLHSQEEKFMRFIDES